MQAIFGYGSLICADSRRRTGVGGPALAVEIAGIERRWSVQVPDYRGTAVGAHLNPNSHCNGVVFVVDDANLARFDERERGYDRHRIDWSAVRSLDSQPLPIELPLWSYVGDSSATPQPEAPILQSYLDVILNGCLSYGDAFARRFLHTTGPWQHLCDDRSAPLYPRAMNEPRLAIQVDALLTDELPHLLTQRQSLPVD
ncbi:gamma-glutamylcyclotransferase family protein [Saccharospirillum mangrovi]|uniref:gamma-glutamylcyclotransferase family protein n=1 Tax=Saccharospirillum mangrovi TaxID=2161747 RepID=UPI000D3BA31B|nr:gamma-glutamylcyclotransferase family protein [Saccharospirillum mangrovi]